jgi:dipeptidyl aminopeptidase/acylaminoacyl peptidase
MEVERADIAALEAAGWVPPEVFVAKGRDGTTDIWGLIFRPTNFDESRTYPVIEYIYAGPHDSFVPKSFQEYNGMREVAELGFIVVQIDGMGTSNRSKAFHDVAWQNLKDAGFPDRILWHRAVAAQYPYYDIDRVGIYGTSAGGQSSLGGLLFHPDFYDVAVSAVGCHDNRMDKIWWNEQWMGWPIGPHYAASSNVDNAYRLQGDVLLIVGELDTNVDPASTMQVVDALIEANKPFDLLVIPGANHTSGGEYGQHKRMDYFVQHLLDVKPPEWAELEAALGTDETADRASQGFSDDLFPSWLEIWNDWGADAWRR